AHEPDGDGAAPLAAQVVDRAVVRVHQPDVSRGVARGQVRARLLAAVAPVREGSRQAPPQDRLGLVVGGGAGAAAARARLPRGLPARWTSARSTAPASCASRTARSSARA